MDLNKLLIEYRNITLEMIRQLSENQDISLLVKKREDILKIISSDRIDKSGIKKISETLKLNDCEEKLYEIIRKSMLDVRKDIKKIKQSQAAYNKYNNFSGNALIFSTKR